MLRVRPEQIEVIGKVKFLERLKGACIRSLPEFSTCDKRDQETFLVDSLLAAEACGLRTEQGIASYALAAWWLGIGFESESRLLQALLSSRYPELRKAHSMNQWVRERIGQPDDPAAADLALRQAFSQTVAWGGD